MAMGLFIFLLAGNNLRAQTNWVKYENNPVLETLDQQAWDAYTVYPTVLVVGDSLRMWYSGSNTGALVNYQIGHASSNDGGETWTVNEDPVIPVGNPGDWNKNKMPCTVLLGEDDTLRMWYTASNGSFGTNSSIGFAKRLIGDNEWEFNEGPVLEVGSSGDWDDVGTYKCSVIFDENAADSAKYKMWYHGWDESADTPDGEIGYAYSTNGVDWEKYSDNPVVNVGAPETFYDTWITPGTVLLGEDDTLRMWFTGWDGFNSSSPRKYDKVGYATSLDGIVWTDGNGEEPVLNVGASGDWDQDQVRGDCVVIQNNILKMFFTGYKFGSGYHIGLATGGIVNTIKDLNQLSEFEMLISPNPTNDITTISYHLATASTTTIVIYNQQGQIISTLLDEKKQAGDHEIKFDSSGLPSGIYFCVLKANDEIQTAKIVKL